MRILAFSKNNEVKGIPIYHELNDMHIAVGSALRSSNPVFHCFDMSEMNNTLHSLSSYRTGFFTLALSFGSDDFNITINDTQFTNLKHFLICVAPGQISGFQKTGAWSGFCTFFKAEFVQHKNEINFLEDFPFFNLREINIFPVTDEQFKFLSQNFRQILHEQLTASPFHTKVIANVFQAVLWQVRRIYENAGEKRCSDKAGMIIASKFQYLVNQLFISKVFVEQYADMLNISPNHLSQTIKEVTGKTAKNIISQRRVEEAKYLLKYTNNDIATISHHLQFSEPTHFNKFFKKECGNTPLSYRKIFRLPVSDL